ncbi:YciI family protein [Symbioplanes lichenis]|uniref:YciI family protein n=1 Tax=Symbioplanes lichenis TaxID=1629072 RepID=UPI0027394386|nr:YciI family protein [Actinoplanes lichenis]
MPQYAVLIHSGGTGAVADHDEYARELIADGTLAAAFALAETATSIRDGQVTDGPYAETKDVVAGFFILEAPDLATAVAIAERNPEVRHGGGVEVRPITGAYTVRDPGVKSPKD